MSIATAAAESSLQARRIWLAPICLCLVAALHLYRVTTAGQTPWKGGGFGMFSTIDSEGARFVQAYVRTSTGVRPVQIPSDLDKKIAELRAAPSQAQTHEIASRLAKLKWLDPQRQQQQFHAQLRARPADQPLTGAELRELRSAPAAATTNNRPAQLLVAAGPKSATPNAIPFDLVRVEVWKQTMIAGTTRLEPKLLYFSACLPPEKQP